jgi:hypothetical protein
MYKPSNADLNGRITVFHFEQGNNKFKAVVALNEKPKQWSVNVFYKVPDIVESEIYVKLDNYCLSHSVEWMALEYATRIRNEELEIPGKQ